mmetsp:Transcript_13643/g.20771  ORF Transcript_13643/g.20771 Transcript_13643/m.20771 type:complete len:277 (-) Transcript_13643:1899-2729(-)
MPDGISVDQKGDEKYQEEDWSEIMSSLDLGAGFARHDHDEGIALIDTGGCVLRITSTSSLSPLDMMNLSWGLHDTTGHRIWMGARLFLSALPQFGEFFSHRCVLELGTGTGLSGIAISKYFHTKKLVLTDASESVLDLCRSNVDRNRGVGGTDVSNSACCIQVEKLTWGESLAGVDCKFDTVFATDVLYDINSWEPLLQSVVKSLRNNGIFVLSHVPRAALPEGEDDTLEGYLTFHAKCFNLHRILNLRPSDVLDNFDIDMEEAGASILFFLKKEA